MLHIVPILCLIAFIGLVEFRLQKEFIEIKKKLNELEKQLNKN